MKQIEETLGLVLESAQEEFLSKGYEKANLRSIAQRAGVTTGALYVRFPNKDALFSALVAPVADYLLSVYKAGNEQGFAQLDQGDAKEMWAISDEVIQNMVDYIFDNKTTFALLINCAVGSSYEHFVDDLIVEEEKQSMSYLKAMKEKGYECAEVSEEDIHVLLSAQYYAIFEIVRHNTPKKEATERVMLIADFFRPGWERIFGG